MFLLDFDRLIIVSSVVDSVRDRNLQLNYDNFEKENILKRIFLRGYICIYRLGQFANEQHRSLLYLFVE